MKKKKKIMCYTKLTCARVTPKRGLFSLPLCQMFADDTSLFVSATRRSRDIKIPLCQSAYFPEKFNIVSNDHGRTQVSVGKTNFTDHHTPDTIKGFRDSVPVCKMHDCYCTISKNFEKFYSFSPSQ